MFLTDIGNILFGCSVVIEYEANKNQILENIWFNWPTYCTFHRALIKQISKVSKKSQLLTSEVILLSWKLKITLEDKRLQISCLENIEQSTCLLGTLLLKEEFSVSFQLISSFPSIITFYKQTKFCYFEVDIVTCWREAGLTGQYWVLTDELDNSLLTYHILQLVMSNYVW